MTVDNVRWAGLPDKEEAGSPNVVGAIAQAKTMLALQEIGMQNLADHEAHLTAYLLNKLKKIDGIKIYGSDDPDKSSQRVGVVPITVEGKSHYEVAAILSAEGGIGVRNGCFCAHPYLFQLLKLSEEESLKYQQDILNGSRASLPGLVRISFGCYNNTEDVDWLTEMLEIIVKNKYKGKYIQNKANGEFWPEGYRANIKEYFSL